MRHGARAVDRAGGEAHAQVAEPLLLDQRVRPEALRRDIIDYANTRGADKIIYAGYFPAGLTYDRIWTTCPNVPFKDEVWPKFLRENARKVLKLTLTSLRRRSRPDRARPGLEATEVPAPARSQTTAVSQGSPARTRATRTTSSLLFLDHGGPRAASRSTPWPVTRHDRYESERIAAATGSPSSVGGRDGQHRPPGRPLPTRPPSTHVDLGIDSRPAHRPPSQGASTRAMIRGLIGEPTILEDALTPEVEVASGRPRVSTVSSVRLAGRAPRPSGRRPTSSRSARRRSMALADRRFAAVHEPLR